MGDLHLPVRAICQIFNKMDTYQILKSELNEIKQLTLIGVKNALSMDDVSLLTGLSKSYIYRLVCERKIPYYKSHGGKMTYFSKSELEDWLLNKKVMTTDEIDQKATSYVINRKGGSK